MPVSGQIALQFVSIPIVSTDSLPENPSDGLVVLLNTDTRRQVFRYDAGTATWVLMADYAATDAKLAQIAAGTIESDAYKGLIGASEAILAVASQKDLLDNLAVAMDFGPDGLTITSAGGYFYVVLGIQSLDFRKKTETGYITVTTFGNIRTVTSATLQVGQDGEAATLIAGGLMIQAQAGNGDIDFRRR